MFLSGIGKLGAKAKGRETVFDPLLVDEAKHLGIAVGSSEEGGDGED